MNLETKIIWRWVQNGTENFFNDWNHQYQLNIIVVYHNMQNKKKLTSKSQDNEFGDKNNLETGPKWAKFGPEKFFDEWNHQYQLEIIAVYHNMQNKKKLINKSQDNEFGDKKLIWRQAFIGHKRRKYFFWRLEPPRSVRYHSCLI